MNQNQKNEINLIRAVLTNELSNTQITNLELLCEKYNDTNIINKFEIISTLETIQEQSIREIQEYIELLKLKPYKYYSIFSTIAVPAYKIAGFPFLGMGVVEMNDDIKPLCSSELNEKDFLTDSDYKAMYNICKEYTSKNLLTKNDFFPFIVLNTIYEGYITLKSNYNVA